MASYTCIAIIDQKKQKVLFCKRVKPPFANLLNFVGGKIDANETPLVSAYRELVEETGITKNDIVLKPLVNFQFIEQKTQLYIYYGVLNKPVKLVVEFQKLIWKKIRFNNFFSKKYAGNGNIGWMINEIKKFIF